MIAFMGVVLLGVLFLVIWLLWAVVDAYKTPAKPKSQPSVGSTSAHVPLLGGDNTPCRDTPRIDISFSGLGLRLGSATGTSVLDGVTGTVRSGRLTAVMGPSGAGKTTFLSALSGRAHYGVTVGEVLLNGQNEPVQSIAKLVGYVPQDDVMHPDLSCRENLVFSALTRLPDALPRDAKLEQVDRVIAAMGLSDVAEKIVGDANKRGVSGGQKKRVNIGMELVAEPSVLFLDEPTSGLDSASSREVIGALKAVVSADGINAIAVIHQPSVSLFSLFDDVLLLGKGGRTVYLGPVAQATEYFASLGFSIPERTSEPDWFLDIIAGDAADDSGVAWSPQRLFEAWETRVCAVRAATEAGAPGAASASEPPPAKALLPLVLMDDAEVREHGTPADFVIAFVSCFILFPASLFFVRRRLGTVLSVYGALFGLLNLCACIAVVLIVFELWLNPEFKATTNGTSMLFIMTAMLVTSVALMGVLGNVYRRGWQLHNVPEFLQALLLGPLALLVLMRASARVTVKQKYAAACGFFLFTVIVGLLVWATIANFADFFGLAMVGLAVSGLAGIVVFFHRYAKLPSRDRKTATFFGQLRVFTQRALVQLTRNRLALAFDVGLVVLPGLFVGCIYYGRVYQGPMFGIPGHCPLGVTICTLLALPVDDPLPGMAVLTCMALALSAMASSLRVFGTERLQFLRENSSGTLTEAYYLGKSFAHLVVICFVPLCFTLAFYPLAGLQGGFFKYYALFLSVYGISAGLAYLVSIAVPPSMAQLVGVLAILTSTMFSGANPTIQQLRNNHLIPNLLVYPSYFSFIRWSQELFYLIEMEVIDQPGAHSSMTLLYGYKMSDFSECYLWSLVIGMFFRLLAYLVLVKREQ